MAKKIKVAATAATITTEEFLKLTPEQQADILNAGAKAQEKLDEATRENKKLKAAIKDTTVRALPIVEGVEEDEKNEIPGGDYQFTCPTFHWDDNTVINVFDLMEQAESGKAKEAEAAQVIIAKLLQRKSGILALVPEKESA